MFIFDSDKNLINTDRIIDIHRDNYPTENGETKFVIIANLTYGTAVLHKCFSVADHEKAFSDLCTKLGVII
jgi:hypothetical protein